MKVDKMELESAWGESELVDMKALVLELLSVEYKLELEMHTGIFVYFIANIVLKLKSEFPKCVWNLYKQNFYLVKNCYTKLF